MINMESSGEASATQDRIKRSLETIALDKSQYLYHLVLRAREQSHGTMVVVCNNAGDESKRLHLQCRMMKKTILCDDIVVQLASIDGSILVDVDGYCHAIGVILDGVACDKVVTARGARYNSAVKYVEQQLSKHVDCVAFVMSEDGGISEVANYGY